MRVSSILLLNVSILCCLCCHFTILPLDGQHQVGVRSAPFREPNFVHRHIKLLLQELAMINWQLQDSGNLFIIGKAVIRDQYHFVICDMTLSKPDCITPILSHTLSDEITRHRITDPISQVIRVLLNITVDHLQVFVSEQFLDRLQTNTLAMQR